MTLRSLNPVYRIRTERLLLRCWEPSDAAALRAALERSREHLLPWMPWAESEPQSVEEKVVQLRRFRGQFDLGEDYVYGAFDPETGSVVGGTGLRPRVGPGGLEIGYWVHVDHLGRGFATEMTAALARVAIESLKVRRVEVRCAPDNRRSMRIPERLGFTREAERRRIHQQPDGSLRDVVVWTLHDDRFPESPCATARFTAYGPAGTLLFERMG